MSLSRAWILGLGLAVAACGSQPESIAATNSVGNDGGELSTVPTEAPAPAAAPDPAAANEQSTDAQSYDASNQTGAGVLNQIFLKAGTFDGKPITKFELRGKCETVFTTADGTGSIDWRKVGNFAGRDNGDRWELPVDNHVISVPGGEQPEPLGNASARVESALSVIADSCQG